MQPLPPLPQSTPLKYYLLPFTSVVLKNRLWASSPDFLHWERRGLSQPGISAHTQPLAWFPRVALLCSLPPPSPSCSTDAEERGLQLGEAGSGWLEGKHCAARVVLED